MASGESEKSENHVQVAPPVSSSGSPLPGPARHQMETAFGADFSALRIHQGPQAALIDAQAYTTGSDIHFAPGQYDPHSSAGRELLGHELWHVVQQKEGRASLAKGLVQV
jgi:hypothetical protein